MRAYVVTYKHTYIQVYLHTYIHTQIHSYMPECLNTYMYKSHIDIYIHVTCIYCSSRLHGLSVVGSNRLKVPSL